MDTIAAISTANLPAAVAMVRLSGEDSFPLLARVFRPLAGDLAAPRRMVYGEFLNADGEVIDRGMAVRFPAPASYTGEDTAELYLHGAPLVARLMLDSLLRLGARAAEAGEFSKRAFLNGKMDLSEAEAVGDLLYADSEAVVKNAAAQLSGALRRRTEPLYDALMSVTARFYAVVDHPDDDIRDLDPAEIGDALSLAETGLSALLDTFRRGNILKQGVLTAIIGAPNAGKSSLLNALLGYDRVIVTDVPGTTRDTVEEKITFGGVPLRLTDTAGLRDSADTVERLGIERSRRVIEDAALLFVLIDGSRPLTAEDTDTLRLAEASGKPWLCLLTKCDKGSAVASLPASVTPISVSSVTEEGFPLLEAEVRRLFPAGCDAPGTLLTNERQYAAVARALAAVRRAREAYDARLTPDAILTDAEDALSALGELTGKTLREDLVQTIFSRFCVGK